MDNASKALIMAGRAFTCNDNNIYILYGIWKCE